MSKELIARMYKHYGKDVIHKCSSCCNCKCSGYNRIGLEASYNYGCARYAKDMESGWNGSWMACGAFNQPMSTKYRYVEEMYPQENVDDSLQISFF